MLMPTSSEFVALCRAQIALLTQGLGASYSVVYLTQEWMQDGRGRLVPVAAYPEAAVDWEQEQSLALPLRAIAFDPAALQPLVDDAEEQPKRSEEPSTPLGAGSAESRPEPGDAISLSQSKMVLIGQRQIVLPLLHDNMALGLLVTERYDRSWTVWEQTQIDQIATTLAIACVLDQRQQWLQQEQHQQQVLQAHQRDVMDNLLHQFRNSLTALQTFGKLLLRRLLPGDTNHNAAESIVRETTRLKELAQQLEQVIELADEQGLPSSLPPAQISADASPTDELSVERPFDVPLLPISGFLGGKTPALEACSMPAILEPLLASAATIAEEKGLTLQAHSPANLPLVWAHPLALREVLNNLIENALKYTPAGGVVSVEVTVVTTAPPSDVVQVSVTDTGPGIPPQDLPRVFERHYRGIQADSAIPGSGLGLAIARTLVEQMQGTIQVISPAIQDSLPVSRPDMASGPGTTFIVQLPVALDTSISHG